MVGPPGAHRRDACGDGGGAGGVGEGRAGEHWVGQLRRTAAFLLPPRCLGCGERIPPDAPDPLVCRACLTRLRPAPWPRCARCHLPIGTGRPAAGDCLACRPWPPALRRARWAVPLAPPADALVHGLKYEGWRALAGLMASRMAGALDRGSAVSGGSGGAGGSLRSGGPGAGREIPIAIPMPTTRRRERKRGYNQALLLAEGVARLAELPLADAMKRKDGGRTQVSLLPEERRENVAEAFSVRVREAEGIRGRHCLLIDDVLTTGATASAAALTLERAGASGVTLLTFARSLPGRESPAPGATSVAGDAAS